MGFNIRKCTPADFQRIEDCCPRRNGKVHFSSSKKFLCLLEQGNFELSMTKICQLLRQLATDRHWTPTYVGKFVWEELKKTPIEEIKELQRRRENKAIKAIIERKKRENSKKLKKVLQTILRHSPTLFDKKEEKFVILYQEDIGFGSYPRKGLKFLVMLENEGIHLLVCKIWEGALSDCEAYSQSQRKFFTLFQKKDCLYQAIVNITGYAWFGKRNMLTEFIPEVSLQKIGFVYLSGLRNQLPHYKSPTLHLLLSAMQEINEGNLEELWESKEVFFITLPAETLLENFKRFKNVKSKNI